MTISDSTEDAGSSVDLRRRSVTWIISLALVGLIFDGYDLVVYGTLVPIFLRDPSHIGPVDPALAGALGSYALIGVLVGALMAGSVADIVGRRKVMLTAYVWFSIGMIATAFAGSASSFGALRFLTGIGVGALVATTGALVAEFAPPGRKNVCNAITYSGVPLGSLLAALLAILLLPVIGWRGMLLIGGLPLVTLFPLALIKMPESPAWLMSRGRISEAEQVALRCGIPLAEIGARPGGDDAPEPVTVSRAGFAGLFRDYFGPTVVLGLMSVVGLLLVYALNTWLPELMGRAGFSTAGSLGFLLVLNGGAVIGALFASRLADRFGPKRVVAASFALGAVAIVLMTVDLPLAVLLAFVAVVGLGTSGTQILIFGFVATYYRTNVRSAGVAWCAGFGRLGGVGGPLVGGLMVASGLALDSIFYTLAGLAFVGVLLTWIVPASRAVATPGSENPATTSAAS